MLRGKLSSGIGTFLLSLGLILGGSARAIAQSAVTPFLDIDRGCGSTSYRVGDPIRFDFGVTGSMPSNQTVHLTLTLQRNRSTTTLFDGNVTAPFSRSISGTVGSPAGQTRTLTLTVTGASVDFRPLTCAYTPGSGQSMLTGSVQTQNGCGVTFEVGNRVDFQVTSSQPANFRLAFRRPNGTGFVLTGSVPAGTSTVSTGTAGLPEGTRTLDLTLQSRTTRQTATAPQCAYNVRQAIGFAPAQGGNR